MSSRAFKRLLIHRCSFIKRGVVVGKDEYNRNIYEDVTIHDIPCRFDTIRKRVVNNDKNVDVVEENVLFVLPSNDIDVSLQVINIRTKDDIPILSGTFTIEKLNPQYSRKKLNHFELELKKVSADG
ncbi:hypothetical protein [Bacillus luti]|uniref:hypothetical protein n=1 Tax=Bacillus luti TaxID=2026191 RepID=UPI002897A270|nr:hypothetical protein [Bacillus luti]